MSHEYGENYSYLNECRQNWEKPTYRAWWLTRSYLEIARKVNLERGSRILSVGSGIGQLEHFLDKTFGYEVVCLDMNPHALQTGKNLLNNDRSLVANATSLPFPDKSVDLVLSYDFMEHLPNEHTAQDAFSEMERVLRIGNGIQMLHKITVKEEGEAINADNTHHIKWFANEWQRWFEGRGWHTQKPTSHKIPIWSRKKIGLYPVIGAFYLGK